MSCIAPSCVFYNGVFINSLRIQYNRSDPSWMESTGQQLSLRHIMNIMQWNEGNVLWDPHVYAHMYQHSLEHQTKTETRSSSLETGPLDTCPPPAGTRPAYMIL